MGCEKKLCTSDGLPGLAGNSVSVMTAGLAMVKVSDSLSVLPLEGRHLAWMATRSPGAG